MIDILGEGRSRARMPRSLILEPTRELAAQVAENFEKYGKYHKLSMALLIGGVQMGDQIKALEKGVDVLIATPGRLMDLFSRGKILLTGCDLLVIDEADRMLDMGFIPDIEEICTKLPKQRQTLLFSATMPPVIQKLAAKFLTEPRRIEVARPASSNLNIDAKLVETRSDKKRDVLRELLRAEDVTTAIIFCNRKTTVRELATSLKRSNFAVGQIHGDMEQAARIAELDRFKARRDQHPGRLRRRRPRARHQGRQPRLQLRRAVAARRLRPPDRPHRPRRRQGQGLYSRHPRGWRSGVADREADRDQDPAARRSGLDVGSGRGRGQQRGCQAGARQALQWAPHARRCKAMQRQSARRRSPPFARAPNPSARVSLRASLAPTSREREAPRRDREEPRRAPPAPQRGGAGRTRMAGTVRFPSFLSVSLGN